MTNKAGECEEEENFSEVCKQESFEQKVRLLWGKEQSSQMQVRV